MYACSPAPILHRDLWPTIGYLVHKIPARECCNGSTCISNYAASIQQCHLSTRDDINNGVGVRLLSTLIKDQTNATGSTSEI